MKLGLFGGTFNPIHFGHIEVAVGVQCKFNFDRVYFIPSRYPPHKDSKELVSANDRCEMILRSISGHLPFSLAYTELNRKELSYSIDTIRYFESKLASKDELFFILGMDAFLEFHTWKSYEKITKLVELIVVSRRVMFIDSDKNDLIVIKEYVLGELFSDLGYNFCTKSFCWKCKGRKPIRHLELESPDVSSSLVREVAKVGKDLEGLVPSAVVQYIREKGLYL